MNNLRLHREKSELSLQGLADLCGVTKAHLHALETGKANNPTLKMAYGLSGIFGISVYELFPDETEIVEEQITVRRIKIKTE